MEDKIIKIEEELGVMQLNLTDGRKIPVNAKTIYTYYESGRKDCTIQVEKPLELGSGVLKPVKEK